MDLDHCILRIFDVRAKPGQVENLRKKLSHTSVDVVDGKPGNLGYFFGQALSASGDDLVFVSIWKDLDAVKSRFGDEWQESFLPEGYEEIIDSCSIRHVEVERFAIKGEPENEIQLP